MWLGPGMIVVSAIIAFAFPGAEFGTLLAIYGIVIPITLGFSFLADYLTLPWHRQKTL
jgi:hypothetical protein